MSDYREKNIFIWIYTLAHHDTLRNYGRNTQFHSFLKSVSPVIKWDFCGSLRHKPSPNRSNTITTSCLETRYQQWRKGQRNPHLFFNASTGKSHLTFLLTAYWLEPVTWPQPSSRGATIFCCTRKGKLKWDLGILCLSSYRNAKVPWEFTTRVHRLI